MRQIITDCSVASVKIHDLESMKANKIIAGSVIALVLLASSPFILRFIWPRINEVRTGATPEYPDIQPQRFNQPFDRVFEAATNAALAMGWEMRETDRSQGIIEAIAPPSMLKFLRFKDDVTVTITREGDATVVNVRSKSHLGKGDLGMNARRIRAFQAELAKRL
jgi:uncharacterized protein (DUF1499 family)